MKKIEGGGSVCIVQRGQGWGRLRVRVIGELQKGSGKGIEMSLVMQMGRGFSSGLMRVLNSGGGGGGDGWL